MFFSYHLDFPILIVINLSLRKQNEYWECAVYDIIQYREGEVYFVEDKDEDIPKKV